ncbi:hypothetical protein GQ85_08455 [Rhodococcus rhodochrous]|nr:hypothetical protein GQ85_08455 [Rhodococcus rhodochrous]
MLKSWADTFAEEVKSNCPGCKVTDLSNTIAQAQANAIVPTITAALSRQPETGYVISADLEFLDALPSALNAAGRQIKVAGDDPGDTTIQSAMKQGGIDAASSRPNRTLSWLMADMVFRHELGLPMLSGEDLVAPIRLLTPDADFEVSPSHDFPADYEEQFKSLWNIG